MIKYESDDSGHWWELLLGWKWPHQGFTIGYDLVMPDEQPENGLYYNSVLIYVGPLSIIYNFGNHEYDE